MTMKVLFVSDWYQRGGAAIAAQRLAQGLTSLGHEVVWSVGRSEGNDPAIHHYTQWPIAWDATHRVTQKLAPTTAPTLQRAMMQKQLRRIVQRVQPDVISVHNIHAVGLPSHVLAQLSQLKPVVWTLHDMWAFTGGCVYSLGCDQFVTGCTRSCPQCGQSMSVLPDQVPKAYASRQGALQHAGRLAFVTPSQWLGKQAKRGLLRANSVQAIPNSIDLNTFAPIPQASARTALGVPNDRPVVLSASLSHTDPRKGTGLLLEAMQHIPANRPITWLTLGQTDSIKVPQHIRHHPLGAVMDQRLLRLVYNAAADVHVLPTLADNLPNVLLEAAACGTPSVAFDVGGVGEAVVNNVTGWTVPLGEINSLANAMQSALQMGASSAAKLRARCRAFAVEHFPPTLQAQRYIKLFESMVQPNVQRIAA